MSLEKANKKLMELYEELVNSAIETVKEAQKEEVVSDCNQEDKSVCVNKHVKKKCSECLEHERDGGCCGDCYNYSLWKPSNKLLRSSINAIIANWPDEYLYSSLREALKLAVYLMERDLFHN